MNRKELRLGYGVLAALTAALAPAVQAQTEEGERLEEIVVLGARDDGFNVALTEELIENKQIVDLEDMFRHEPSITVGGGLPVAQKVYVRGLEDTLLNVTLDGATQAGYLYHHQGRVNIEPELIREVVIEAGAGRATAGPGALGGAVNFVTKDAFDLLEPGQRFGALLKGAYHDINDGTKSSLNVYGALTDSFGFLASVSRFDTEDYDDGSGATVANSAVEQNSVMLKLSGEIMPDHTLRVSYEQRDDDAVRFARPNMVGIFHPVYPSTAIPQETWRESWIASYGFNPQSEAVNLTATLYYNDNYLTKRGDEYLDHWPPSPPFTFTDYYNGAEHGGGVESTGFDLGNSSTLGGVDLEYGLEARNDRAYLINTLVAGFQDEKTEVRALYMQADVELNDLLTLGIGARYDDYDYTDNHGVNFSDDSISPNVGLNVSLTPEFTLNFGYAQAFRGVSSPEVWFLEFPPTFSGLTSYVGPDFDLSGFTAGTLGAEEAENLELGFTYRADGFAASGEIFNQTIDNAQVTGTTERYSYKQEVEIDGYALRVGYFWPQFSLNLGVSETEPTLAGEPLSSGDMGLGTAYGRTWTAAAEYNLSGLNLDLGWNLRLVEDLDFVRAGQDEKDGYDVHDFYARWQASENLLVNVVVSNAFDEFYYDQGTFFTRDSATPQVFGLPEPGRNVRVSASFQF